MELKEILPLLIPLIAIQLVLIVVALRDLIRPERKVRGGDKRLWAIVIVLGELFGPLIYLTIGRIEE
jgi:hypothetical protein